MFRPGNAKPGQPNAGAALLGSAEESGAVVPAVAKAFRLLEELSQSGEPLGTSELARRLRLGKSTVHGLVSTLASIGVIETVDGSKRYRIGRGLHALTGGASGHRDIRGVARASLERLALITEQTSFLGVPVEDHVTVLDTVHGRPTMSISAPVGSKLPLLAGAVGKAVLSSWGAARREAFLATQTMPAFTPKSIVDPSAYQRALDDAVARGAAIDVDEYVDGMRAAAAPVFSPPGQLAAVIWVAGFSRHIDRSRLLSMASEVAREANELSRKLA
jgi:DNA-binding IclR family transcriptional regulator